MSVTLRKRDNNDGSTSLVLDIYHNGKRSYEFLKHLKLSASTAPIDKQGNKDKLDQAKKIATKRAQELSANDYDMTTDAGKKTLVTEWMDSYIKKYTKKDKRNLEGALNRFKAFLIEDKKQGLTFGRLTESVIMDYRDYLQEHSQGEGALSYYQRFKKMLKQAVRDKLLLANPAADVSRPKGEAKERDILTLEEIKILYEAPTESDNVKRAFIFSCMTGLRWIEVKNLKWDDVNVKVKSMKVVQTKTGKAKSIPLNDVAIKMIGKPGKDADYVFDLPTANGANKTLKSWVKRAQIKKKITWHNARHSHGTNLIITGADVKTVSKLLGHSTMHHTNRYVKIAAEMMERATDKLNIDI